MSNDIAQDANSSTNGKDKAPAANVVPTTTRGGLRVYKIVVLGDGGVGKSGILYFIIKFKVVGDFN